MKKFSAFLMVSTTLALGACGHMGEQLFDPDITFANVEQPDVKGINDTQEQMAKEAVAAGDHRRAAQFYEQLVAAEKGTPEQILRYKLGWAEALRRDGDNQRALAMFEQLHREQPGNIDIAEGRGLTLMAAGKVPDAGRAFSEVIEKDPKRWRSLNALGILFVTKNMVPEAMAYYTEALNQSPDNPAILNNVGLSQAVDRNYPRAIEALEHASRVSKTMAQRKQIEMNLAMVQGVSGDFESARATAGKYMEGAALDNNLGLYAHLAKDDNLAKTYFNMALAQSPTFYQRAWENLDAVGSGATDPEGVKRPRGRSKPLPSADTLSATATAAEAKPEVKKSTRKGKRSKASKPAEVKKEAPAKEETKPEVTGEEPAAKPEADATVKADEKPVEKSADEVKAAEDIKPVDKPTDIIKPTDD